MFANCTYASQGFIMAAVYFTLEKKGTQRVESALSPGPGVGDDGDNADEGIPSMATGTGATENSQHGPASDVERGGDAPAPTKAKRRWSARSRRGSGTTEISAAAEAIAGFRFNIFDADPDEDSPWAEFFRDEEDDAPPLELPPQLAWTPEEGDAGKNLDLKTKLYLCENVLRT